ncbi:homocysteine S-methyltransferase [Actinomyces ruminicola]|uniref:Homocysteine S-methyltransferase n=1 Tax=Actinomyces ruminicola TaxID=332524 RepID=A0A1G9WHG5_9ACTO|nr:homocysteine S-methyltransferase [Actinomyces ruminicola]SDM83767.1 homocysteine S-methyltransferase [Actinomyces ruminicola]
MSDALVRLLAQRGTIVLDGAMATELEKRGVDTSGPLWSALAMRDAPGAIAEVHRSFFEAGADVATTNTYQANLDAYRRAGLSGPDAENLVRQAVRLARRARDEHEAATGRRGLVAGSVGPYGAYLADGSEYTGAYTLSEAGFRDFHRPRLRLLVEAGVDVLALETMPQGPELRALLGLLADEAPGVPAWLSLSVRDDGGALRDGTPLEDVAAWAQACPQVRLLGVNCTGVKSATTALGRLAEATSLPLIVYPNSGEDYDADTKTWSGDGDDEGLLAAALPAWKELGVRAAGGCCRTTPAQIRALAAAVGEPAA